MNDDNRDYWAPNELLAKAIKSFWSFATKAVSRAGIVQPNFNAARSMGVLEAELNNFLAGRSKFFTTSGGRQVQRTSSTTIARRLVMVLNSERPENIWDQEYLDWWARPAQRNAARSIVKQLEEALISAGDSNDEQSSSDRPSRLITSPQVPAHDPGSPATSHPIGAAVSLPRLVDFDAMWESNQAPAGQPAIQTRFEFGQMKEREVDADVPYTIKPDRLVLFLECDAPVQALAFAEWVCDDDKSSFRVVEGRLGPSKRYYNIDNPQPKTALIDRADWFSFCYVDGRPQFGTRLTLTASNCGFRIEFDDPGDADEIARMELNKRLLIEQFIKNRALTNCPLEQGSYTLATVELG